MNNTNQTPEAELSALDIVMSPHGPYPLHEILKHLTDAGDILLRKKDYDGHGHEGLLYALRAGEEMYPFANKALVEYSELKAQFASQSKVIEDQKREIERMKDILKIGNKTQRIHELQTQLQEKEKDLANVWAELKWLQGKLTPEQKDSMAQLKAKEEMCDNFDYKVHIRKAIIRHLVQHVQVPGDTRDRIDILCEEAENNIKNEFLYKGGK